MLENLNFLSLVLFSLNLLYVLEVSTGVSEPIYCQLVKPSLLFGLLVAFLEVRPFLNPKRYVLHENPPEEKHGYLLRDETKDVTVKALEVFVCLVDGPQDRDVGVDELEVEHFLDQRVDE